MTKRLLLVEDDSGIAFTVTDRLTIEGYEVEHAAEGLAGEQMAMSGEFDVILLDVMLPGKDGFQICQTLRQKNIETPILMLTARTTDIDTVMGLKLGADDYLTKPFDMSVLLARIEAILRRSERAAVKPSNITDHELAFGVFVLDTQKQELRKAEHIIGLNAQEYRLLHFLVSHPDEVLSRDTLLDAVWGYNSEVTTRTVDVHVAWLRKKLDDQPVAKHLVTLRGRGYKFVLNPDH